MLYVLATIALFVFYYYRKIQISTDFHDNVLSKLNSKYGFFPHYYQIMANSSGAIALDKKLRMICIIDNKLNAYYLFKENIIKTEIQIDDVTYVQKDFFKTWSKYFLLRSVGNEAIAEAGIHMSKDKYVKKINTMKLRISTNNFDKPNHYLLFLKYGNEKDKRMMLSDINDWISRIEAL